MLETRLAVCIVLGFGIAGSTVAQPSEPTDTVELAWLTGQSGLAIVGAEIGDGVGWEVSTAGDVNGDGFDDVLIGAPFTDPDGVSSGSVYVVYGAPAGPPVFQLENLVSTDGFALSGAALRGSTGRSLSDAGDVNGDGFDDLIVGAGGESYVVYGGPAMPVFVDLSTLGGERGFVMLGSGESVSGAGDVNSDGYDDVVVGDSHAFGGGISSGESYLIYGAPSLPPEVVLTEIRTDQGVVVHGASEGDFSGAQVSSAGDFNGDGFDDLLINAWGASPDGRNQAGRNYVVYGSPSLPLEIDLAEIDGVNGISINGVRAGDHPGWRGIDRAGDVNGDGYDDVVFGSYSASEVVAAGTTYVVLGGASLAAEFELSDLDGLNGFSILGIGEYDYSGEDSGGAGDVNGDGYDDVIVGADLADPHGVDGGGESYVVFGRDQFPAEVKLSSLDGKNGFTIFGDESKDGAGDAVAGAGDVNGDGLADLIIGAWPAGEDAPMDVGTGIAYVVTDRTRPGLRLKALGECPGRLKIRASIVDPRGNAAVFFSSKLAPGVVPGGPPCGGTPIDLESAQLLFLGASDADGLLEREFDFTEDQCAGALQAVEALGCRASIPIPVSGG